LRRNDKLLRKIDSPPKLVWNNLYPYGFLLSPAWFMIEAEQREAGFSGKTLGQPDHYPCSQQ